MVRCTLTICIILVGCAADSEIVRFDGAAPDRVRVGRYERSFEMLDSGMAEYGSAVRLRADVEQHEDRLGAFVRDRLGVTPPLDFHFSYAGLDSTSSQLLLRYFALHPNPTVIAGWQVQLVYLLPHTRLVQVYVEALPLE
jgi:hypothetical protein